MTTLVVRLSPSLAVRLAKAADTLRLEHADVARLALRLFLRVELPGMQKAAKART